MYSDDPGKAGVAEHQLENQINELRQKFITEEFGLTQISPDIYSIYNRQGNIKGIIDLRSPHANLQESN